MPQSLRSNSHDTRNTMEEEDKQYEQCGRIDKMHEVRIQRSASANSKISKKGEKKFIDI